MVKRRVYSDQVTFRLPMFGRRGVRNKRLKFAHFVLTLNPAKFVERAVAPRGDWDAGDVLPTSKSFGAMAT